MCAGEETAEGRELYVLHDDVLQKWLIAEPGSEMVGIFLSLENYFWCWHRGVDARIDYFCHNIGHIFQNDVILNP